MLFYQPYLTDTQPRRGVVLLVVIVMLALFAAVGITFVFYAEASSAASQSARQALIEQTPDVDPEMAASMFLEQLLFGAPDDDRGIYSALRGHDLMRNMWGMNYTGFNATNGLVLGNNTVPFNGAGRLHYDVQVGQNGANPVYLDPAGPAGTTPFLGSTLKDNFFYINYTYFPPYYTTDTFNFIRDPGRYGARYDPKGVNSPRTLTVGAYVEEFNPPYTYPDLNCMALGAIDKNGNLLMPSFHRPWLFGSAGPSNNPINNPTNYNKLWTTDVGKYLILRPRPWDQRDKSETDPTKQVIRFPYPEDDFGDVRNLPGSGPNDSYWLNINAPVFRLPDGRKYTMLVAPLIIDLDGKVNLNVHGNIKAPNNMHASNVGVGPWEVAINQVLNKDQVLNANGIVQTPATEWQKLFLGLNGTAANTFQVVGRYGPLQVPTNDLSNTEPSGKNDHYYAMTDVDAAANSTLKDTIPQRPMLAGMIDGNLPKAQFPGQQIPVNNLFPYFHPLRYQDGSTTDERKNHPAVYNALRPIAPNSATTSQHQGYNRNFRVSNMEKLYRYDGTGSDAMTSELLRLCPTNMSDPAVRRLVTLLSANLHRAGAMPWDWPSTTPANGYGTTTPNPPFPQGLASALPYPNPNPAVNTTPPTSSLKGPSEFGTDWRSAIAALTKIDLRRTLRQYPLYGDPKNPSGIQTPDTNYVRFDDGSAGGTVYNAFLAAQGDRQQLAYDLYRRLLVVTGVPPVQNPLIPSNNELATRRWLAQLAVNIVDFIDEDEISTPFNFYTVADDQLPANKIGEMMDTQIVAGGVTIQAEVPKYWVFGTEMPRLVLNEVLAERQNGATALNTITVELFNPLNGPTPTNANPVQAQDSFNVQMYMNQPKKTWLNPNFNNGYAPYKIVVTDNLDPTMVNNDNVTGKPDYRFSPPLSPTSKPWYAETKDVDFSTQGKYIDGTNQAGQPSFTTIPPPITPYVPPQGYFLLKSNVLQDNHNVIKAVAQGGTVPNNTPLIKTANLQYNSPVPLEPRVWVFLRRLANPYLPPDNNLLVGGAINPRFNPYITIDYIKYVPNHDNVAEAATQYGSWAKRQPFAGLTVLNPTNGKLDTTNSQVLESLPVGTALTGHTFGQPNNAFPSTNLVPASGHYHWLVHLDRQPLSPVELLVVSKYQPHELTQNFITGADNLAANRNNHTAIPQWFNPNNRIYRLFEYLECKAPTGWTPNLGGRMMGQININTMWDLETFLALCDPKLQASVANPWGNDNPAYFTASDIATLNAAGQLQSGVWKQLLSTRSPGLVNSANPAIGSVGINGATDHPFWSLATGPLVSGPQIPAAGTNPAYNNPFPNGLVNARLSDTLFLRTNTLPSQGPFDVATSLGPDQQHPYLQNQLLSKIFNNVTTRSNTFAVWLTVGFFEVIDDGTRPVKLGAELNRDKNRHIRHRMFAIIDRTQLQRVVSTDIGATAITQTQVPGSLTIKPTAMSGTTATGNQWNIVPGMVLTIDGGTASAEQVIVTSVMGTPPNQFTANFTKPHLANATITASGNPGPWIQAPFNPHNSSLIAHFSIID
jgi:hypothetical protein